MQGHFFQRKRERDFARPELATLQPRERPQTERALNNAINGAMRRGEKAGAKSEAKQKRNPRAPETVELHAKAKNNSRRSKRPESSATGISFPKYIHARQSHEQQQKAKYGRAQRFRPMWPRQPRASKLTNFRKLPPGQ